jgi:aspartate 1-decarboxylase
MRAANIAPFESVHVWNVTRGTRLETYAITGEEGSRDICVNGAAAHLVRPGDLIIIATYGFITDDVADNQGVEPKVVFVDSENRIQHLGPEVAGPRRRDISGSNPTWNSCC